ncbi:DUF4870 domain-containing protein [Patescibacteria group bacterium]
MDEKNQSGQISSERKLLAAFSYVWIVSVIMLVMKKDDDFVRFHAKQGLVLFIASFIAWIPFLWWLWFVIVVVWLIGFFKALSGERFRIPIIADIAEKIVGKLNL